MKIEGRNSVAEALKSGKTIDRLIIQKDLKDAGANRIIADAKSRGIKIFFRDKEALDRECSGKHQGFVAEITDFKYCDVADILNHAANLKQNPFVVILDGVEDPHNLGSVMRVAECLGVHGIIIPRHRAVSVNDTVVKVSAGAANHCLVAKVTNINDAIDELKAAGVWVFCAENGGNSVYDTNLTGAAAIVVGGEGTGVKRLTRDKCDGVVTIPMFGKVNSLNASVACGIVLYEKVRQEAAKK